MSLPSLSNYILLNRKVNIKVHRKISKTDFCIRLHVHTSTHAQNFGDVLYNTHCTLWKCLSGVRDIERLNTKAFLILILQKSEQKKILSSTTSLFTSPKWKHSLFLWNIKKQATNGLELTYKNSVLDIFPWHKVFINFFFFLLMYTNKKQDDFKKG